jgi:glycosyltransferase involved in cell wall biosynthesis
MRETKRIGIICGYPFPEGMAATNRILAYSKGLIENCVKVDVFIFNQTDLTKSNYPVQGQVFGVNYHYPKTRTWSKYKIVRVFVDHIKAIIITFYNILKEHKNGKYDFIFISSDSLFILSFFIPLLKTIGIKIVFITDEYPIPIRVYLKSKIPIYKTIFYKILLKGSSAMIFMTKNLLEFYNRIVFRPSFILPVIADFSRFDFKTLEPYKVAGRRYLCYMGNMELTKDNVDNIVKAFALIKNNYKDIDLYLYGQPSTTDRTILLSLIDSLCLNNRVFLKGRANFDEVPSILCGAHVLVASQPRTKRAEGGFPTKLGEYLVAEKPVILTEVGEIPLYIKDKYNAFLCEPENPEAYAEKLSYVLENYEEAGRVAQEGRNYALFQFDNRRLANHLKIFLDSI